MLAMFYPKVGQIAGMLGAISGFGCIYMIPTVTYLKQCYVAMKEPELNDAL